MNYIICHYSEIGLKKGNRSFFEKCLIDDIKKKIPSELFLSVSRISGRILVKLTDDAYKSKEKLKGALLSVFGISSFLFCTRDDQEINSISDTAINLLEKERFKTFKIETKRSEKSFSMNSQEVNAQVGEAVLKKIPNVKVQMDNPDMICFIEIVGKDSFISTEKYKGQGGLPASSGGRAISLLSGGIDSPVASFLTMRKGVRLTLVHFHAYPETSKESINKVIEIARLLSRYQPKIKLYLVPFASAQREILINNLPENRMILYRRLMLKISSKIAQKERCSAVVTGESLGQVASQTIENIRVIEEGCEFLILRPLISEDKENIIKKAKMIGSYDISILPHDDCCVRFIPQHPKTKADIAEIMDEERKIDINKTVDQALKEAKAVTF
ncbi:MAG: tRNA uracil 4-sulfurtransferase ThiI [Minisyncoccales bacterium]|jgi:thiamine biosynthesis protein ThiI